VVPAEIGQNFSPGEWKRTHVRIRGKGAKGKARLDRETSSPYSAPPKNVWEGENRKSLLPEEAGKAFA